MQKKLIFMRHAQAQMEQLVMEDKERSLTTGGLQEIDNIKAQISDILGEVSVVHCSNAKRTRQTLGAINSLLSTHAETFFDDRLYNASANIIWDIIHNLSNQNDCVLIVGHNPGLTHIIHTIANAHGQVVGSLPTCGIAICNANGNWISLSPSIIMFEKFIYP